MTTPNMQRRHFEFIADIISRIPAVSRDDLVVRLFVAKYFAQELTATNSNFNTRLFMGRCLGKDLT